MHTPVLLQEVLKSLEVKKSGFYIDATFGEGGYAEAVLQLGAKVLGIDRDKNQIESARLKYQNEKNLILECGNFADIERIAKKNGFYPADAVFFDLGLSMKQLNQGKRGLSYKRLDEPLDMRLDEDTELTVKKIVNSYSSDELYEIFAKNSEELDSRAISESIFRTNRLKKMETVGELVKAIDEATGRHDEKVYRRIFQALRMQVNDEINNLRKGLEGARKVCSKGGKIIIVTFHSVEDRIVKNFIRENNLKIIKPVFGNYELSFEKSAKLRTIIF